MDDPTDESLLEAFARGRDRAFDVLVDRHGAGVKGYALRMLRNAEHAEEVYVETFLRVAQNRGKWERRGTVRGYLYTIAHRQCIDLLRRRKLERLSVPTLVDLASARPVEPSPEAMASLGEQARALEDALQALPEEHRQVLLLRVVHDLSATEVGAVLGLTESQVHSELSYARKRLRETLDRPRSRRAAGET